MPGDEYRATAQGLRRVASNALDQAIRAGLMLLRATTIGEPRKRRWQIKSPVDERVLVSVVVAHNAELCIEPCQLLSHHLSSRHHLSRTHSVDSAPEWLDGLVGWKSC